MTPPCILVAEDEVPVRSLITHVLTGAGFEVLSAADGAAAVALFTQHAARIDLVLLDLCMPGLDGVQTLAELKRLRPGVRAVLMSGYIPDDIPIDPQTLAGTIEKPFAPAQLVALVANALSGQSGPPNQ